MGNAVTTIVSFHPFLLSIFQDVDFSSRISLGYDRLSKYNENAEGKCSETFFFFVERRTFMSRMVSLQSQASRKNFNKLKLFGPFLSLLSGPGLNLSTVTLSYVKLDFEKNA